MSQSSVQPEGDKSRTIAVEGEEQKQPPSAPTAKAEEEKARKDEDDDEESDLDDLDGSYLRKCIGKGIKLNIRLDVLDDFSKPSTTAKQKQPETNTKNNNNNVTPTQQPSTAPSGDNGAFDEGAFMKQLEQDMASMMSHAQTESGTSDNKDFQDTVEQGADAFTKQLEESGVPPGDFLKQLLSEVMVEGGGDGSAGGAGGEGGGGDSNKGANANTANAAESTPESFNDAIQRTMNRMQESGDKATAAANENDPSDVPDEVLLQLLKALESSASGGNEDDIQKMFMGFMEKMSSKDILYEPLKELEGKFEPWIAEKQSKNELSSEDVERYRTQTRIVKDVVAKFEEVGYSDEDSKCREWVWEKMQEVFLFPHP